MLRIMSHSGGLTVNSYGLYVTTQGVTIAGGGLDVSGISSQLTLMIESNHVIAVMMNYFQAGSLLKTQVFNAVMV